MTESVNQAGPSSTSTVVQLNELPQAGARKQPLSRPLFYKTLLVNSFYVQQVMDRSFDRTSKALFSLDVILRIIGDEKEVDEVEGIIQGHMDNVEADLARFSAQMEALLNQEGYKKEDIPDYSSPVKYELEITSPKVGRFIRLAEQLDSLLGLVDFLWLTGIISSKQRTDGSNEWRRRLTNLAGRIIGMEKRARISAHRNGKQKEVEEAAPESASSADDEIYAEAAAGEGDNQGVDSITAKLDEGEEKPVGAKVAAAR